MAFQVVTVVSIVFFGYVTQLESPKPPQNSLSTIHCGGVSVRTLRSSLMIIAARVTRLSALRMDAVKIENVASEQQRPLRPLRDALDDLAEVVRPLLPGVRGVRASALRCSYGW